MTSSLSETIRLVLRKNTERKSKTFWTNYLRHEIEFIGVGIPKIRDIVNAAVIEYCEPDEKKLIAAIQSLMNSKIAEDKLASILLIQEHLNGRIAGNKIIQLAESFFKEKLIFDWNTCDWLCVRILSPVINAGNESGI